MKTHLFSYWLVGVLVLFSIGSPCFGQGRISLDNYDIQTSPQVIYGSSFDASLVGRGVMPNKPTGTTWTVGFYYALGDVTGSIDNDSGGMSDPSTLGGGLILASGEPGDTTSFWEPGLQGVFDPPASDAVINGYTTGLITIELVAYSGSDYVSSMMRGHSTAFTMTPATIGIAPLVGNYMSSFTVNIVPEPSVLGLAGIGFCLFLLFRRRRALSISGRLPESQNAIDSLKSIMLENSVP